MMSTLGDVGKCIYAKVIMGFFHTFAFSHQSHSHSRVLNKSTPQNNLYEKLYGLVEEKPAHFETKKFGGVPLSLMPTALSLMMKSIKMASGRKRKANKKITLNCLYKYIRSFERPELLSLGGAKGAQRSLLAFGFTASKKKRKNRGRKRKRSSRDDDEGCTIS